MVTHTPVNYFLGLTTYQLTQMILATNEIQEESEKGG